MFNYQHILIGLDGSELSERAFSEAIEIAKRNNAELVVAQIIPDTLYTNARMTYPAETTTSEKHFVQPYLDQKVQFAKEHGVPNVRAILKVGSPRRELAFTIPEEAHIDLTVLGVSGKGAFERLLIGSVAQFISVHSNTNVLLIKP
ncbi:universal stress protein [Latilactobacillus curvatus]|uniref:Universal stress protein n=1 Tax=Latilactobacillus curvatus TaxID=28038 RepID=A0A1X7QJ14_LATCU|nr:universal stress protein [Latilactobacillus curvatus]AXN35678.1 universal stress protein [Latilactobacillus curvatus]AZP96579.1 universal stress protein [Latilactobacillus curvatus]MCT3525717.1 universal stress protein [Latilactobacillus curvatus]MCW8779452.1 universal stress protein [Latilactobacillus curvatus]UTB70637.1 universal stress protein [Latilactobacillus curvatus]